MSAEKPRVREIIVVEGRYDKGAVLNAVDAMVVETAGFGVFHDTERVALLRRLARQPGLILLMDGDGAGFLIRNYLKRILPPGQLKHAYIPDRPGKERRKRHPGKEGKLGVEGMPSDVILQALRGAGATFAEEGDHRSLRPVTKTDLYRAGLSGGPDSAARRRALLRYFDLPERMTANALAQALSLLCGYEEFRRAVGLLFEMGEEHAHEARGSSQGAGAPPHHPL